MKRISSFEPIIDRNAKILILGSVPGVKSLEMQEYYAHPQNKFWRILFELYQETFSTEYPQKLEFLRNNKIAVWDVIDSCERAGSLDSKIKNEAQNDIAKLLEKFPNIKAVFCNGKKSFQILQKQFGENIKIPVIVLPSTSPAHAIPFEKKLKSWTEIKDFA